MLRWVRRARQEMTCPDVDAFLKDLEAVCRKHNLSISHEDEQGGFEIEEFSEEKLMRLKCATDARR